MFSNGEALADLFVNFLGDFERAGKNYGEVCGKERRSNEEVMSRKVCVDVKREQLDRDGRLITGHDTQLLRGFRAETTVEGVNSPKIPTRRPHQESQEIFIVLSVICLTRRI